MNNLICLYRSLSRGLAALLGFGLMVVLLPSRGEAAGSQNVLFGMNDNNTPGVDDELIRLDFATGVASHLHTFSGLSLLESLCYDPFLDVLWTTNSGFLYKVNPHTYATTPIGPTGYSDIDGLAIQPGTGVLYGVTFGGNDLITINKTNASSTLINGHVEEGHRLEDLAFDSAGRLYILTTAALVQVNPSNGNELSSVPLSNTNSVESLVWWPDGNTFLSGADRDNFKDLVTIDKNTGLVTFVSPTIHSGVHDFDALAIVPLPGVGVQAKSWSGIKDLYR